MSGNEFEALSSPERVALRRIRNELGMARQRNPCPMCGDERWLDEKHGLGRPIESCETCGGRRVRAANLLRVILEHARVGLGLSRPAGLGRQG